MKESKLVRRIGPVFLLKMAYIGTFDYYEEKFKFYMDLFTEIAVVIILAALFGVIANRFKQPTIVGYILVGLIAGPIGILKLNNLEVLDTLAEIGIALLLFLVGLEMNIRDLRHVGKPAFYAGVGQLVFTAIVGFFIVTALGFSLISSIYISVALTFSSTIIVLKLLSEKKDVESLYGKITIGLLLVQDFFAILSLIFLSGLERGEFSLLQFAGTLLKGLIFFVIALFLGQKIFPWLLAKIGRSQELLFIFSVAWGLGVATFLASNVIGLSLEIGGFLAGLTLAQSSTHFQIASRLRPLRDFFVIFFFIVLGARVVLGDVGSIISPAIILSLFVLLGNPLIVLLIMGFLGYRARTSFLTSLSVAQISEFSLILMALGFKLGHIESRDVSLVTLVGIVTIIVSSYFIMHGNRFYKLLKGPLKIFEFRTKLVEDVGKMAGLEHHIVLVGAHRMGRNILGALSKINESFVVVDFNPLIVEELTKQGVRVFYGDIADDEIQEHSGLRLARLVISTVPDIKDSLSLIEFMKKYNPKAKIIVSAESEWEGMALYREGADYVLLPHFIGGQQLAELIKKDKDLLKLGDIRARDISLLRENA